MRKLLLTISIALFCCGVALAQRTVAGKVTDANGKGLIGVSVLVKETDEGRITEMGGDYFIRVQEEGHTLVFSCSGYETVEVVPGASNAVDVILPHKSVRQETTVVTALGLEREQRSLGYAVQQFQGEEVSQVKDFNFINSLSGKAAGANIRRSNQLGGSANMILRGHTSLSGNNQPLFVVDGVIVNNDISNSIAQQTGRGGYDYGNAAMDINPDDIESISILRGAAASALYGARAANGVVMIATKRGEKTKGLGVEASFGLIAGQIDETTFPVYQKEYGPGFSTIQGWYPDDRGFEYFDFGTGPALSTVVYHDASFGPKFDPQIMAADWRSYYRDWDKYKYGQLFPYVAAENDARSFFTTSLARNANVSVNGATDRNDFRLSYTHYDHDGVQPNSNFKRNTVSFSGGHKVTPKLTASATAHYTLTEALGRFGTGYDNRNPNLSFRQWYQVTTDMSDQREAYEQTRQNISWNPYGSLDSTRATAPHYFDNYYFNRYENFQSDERNRLFGKVQLQYAPMTWLNFTARMSTDRYSELREERVAVGSVGMPSYSRLNRSFYENNLDLFANFNKRFLGTINLGAMAGANIRRSKQEALFAATSGGLVAPRVYSLANSLGPVEPPSEESTRVGMNGYFGQVSAGLRNVLFLDVTGRYDISSALPVGNNAYLYPSASLGFVFSEMLRTRWLNYGKFRANYAQVGNDATPQSILDAFAAGASFNGVPLASFPGDKNNPNLLPENTESTEFGLELRLFKNRLGIDASIYEANTFNQFLPVSVSAATGSLSRFINAGQIRNRGVEVILNLALINSKNFKWNVGVNWSKNENEVVELFGDQQNLQLYNADGGISLNATVGQPFGAIWGSNYVFHTDGSPIVYPHSDGGVRYHRSSAPEIIGNINPDWIGGVSNTFFLGNLSLGFLIDCRMGGEFFSLDTWYGYATGVYDLTAGLNQNGIDVRELPDNGGGIFIEGAVVETGTDLNGIPISNGAPNQEAFYASDRYSSLGYLYAPNAFHVYDASFAKLRELSLSYNLSPFLLKRLGVQSAEISLVGRNLWIIYKKSPYSDPEDAMSAGNFAGYQSGSHPAVRELGFNLRLRF